jgi:hypothetical protein
LHCEVLKRDDPEVLKGHGRKLAFWHIGIWDFRSLKDKESGHRVLKTPKSRKRDVSLERDSKGRDFGFRHTGDRIEREPGNLSSEVLKSQNATHPLGEKVVRDLTFQALTLWPFR